MKTLPKLKKALWKLVSEFVRRRDKGVCFTCEKTIPDYYDRYGNLLEGWKAGQCGHFVTAKVCPPHLYFNLKNLHCQCYQCNINLSGNWTAYLPKMIKVYGQEETDKLLAMKWDDVKWSQVDYLEKIAEFKKKLKEFENV